MVDLVNSPIKYSEDVKPDTLLRVFDQDFHVHSMVLRVHSAFFRKFLDSPDKIHKTTSESDFRYEWVTKIDEDGTGWSLVSTAGPSGKLLIGKLNTQLIRDKKDQIAAFKILMDALYHCALVVNSTAQLVLATNLADYYQLLPILSKAIESPMRQPGDFQRMIPYNSMRLLEAAYKLKNETAFRECMIYVLGPWHKPQWTSIPDEALRAFAAETSAKLNAQVFFVLGELRGLVAISSKDDSEAFLKAETGAYAKNRNYQAARYLATIPSLPVIVHSLKENHTFSDRFHAELEEILRNDLVLHGGDVALREFKDTFLCQQLQFGNTPWSRAKINKYLCQYLLIGSVRKARALMDNRMEQ